VTLADEQQGTEVLAVDQDERVTSGLTTLFGERGVSVTGAVSHAEALDHMHVKFFGVVLIDLDTPGPNEGIDLLLELKPLAPASTFVILSSRKSFEGAVASFRAGAADFIVKAPDQIEYLRRRVVEAAREVTRERNLASFVREISETHDEFLKRMMDSERSLVDLRDQVAGRDTSRADFETDYVVLVVDPDDTTFNSMKAIVAKKGGWILQHATTGGEAMDRGGRGRLHIALVRDQLPDLPVSIVLRALKESVPEMITIEFSTPGAKPGKVMLNDGQRTLPLVEAWTDSAQIIARFGELREAFVAKGRERRYLQAFRDKHYEFLRKYSDLKKRLARLVAG